MNPLKRLLQSRAEPQHAQIHMTWASHSVSKSITRAGVFLRKQIWVWPIAAVVILSVLGFFVRRAIESTIKDNVRSGLTAIVQMESEMLLKWFEVQESTAEALANDAHVRELIYGLIRTDQPESSEDLISNADLQRQIEKELGPTLEAHDYIGYLLVDKSKQVVASSHRSLVGQQDVPEYDSFLTRVLGGETIVSNPFPSVVMLKSRDGKTRSGVPTMYACAPVRDESFQVIGALAVQIQPEREFTEILQLGRVGASGETYAFDADGMMVSNSRFDDDLILLGLLADQPGSRSMLQLPVRDPGADMTIGFRPGVRRSELPLTKMAETAINGGEGVDVEGYRDYRGVMVIGAWVWMPSHELGVTTEVDVAQAFRPLVILQRAFLTVFTLLVVSAIAIFVFTIIVARLQFQAREAAIEAQQLGQYTLDQKLGEGAMGVVYKGHHSMLRRPTAIKLLSADKVNDASIARFEHEVQITCQLTHSNTIAIFDYGRTPEGVFYYAMEYLDGVDLQQLVDKYGPQTESRVIHILTQMCGSLFEAHSNGLVHRDIKPANVMLNRRGCEPDVIKVLDFGLVKAVDQSAKGPRENAMAGTPLYMSPESIQAPMTVDASTDIYAVGAVGYFLLTGQPVFEAKGMSELCQKHLEEVPLPPSARKGVKVSGQLEDVIMSCLEKSRAKRPQTARDVALSISKCEVAGTWTVEDGDRWWGRHDRTTSASGEETSQSAAPVMEQTMEQTMDQTRPEAKSDPND